MEFFAKLHPYNNGFFKIYCITTNFIADIIDQDNYILENIVSKFYPTIINGFHGSEGGSVSRIRGAL